MTFKINFNDAVCPFLELRHNHDTGRAHSGGTLRAAIFRIPIPLIVMHGQHVGVCHMMPGDVVFIEHIAGAQKHSDTVAVLQNPHIAGNTVSIDIFIQSGRIFHGEISADVQIFIFLSLHHCISRTE